MSPSKPTRDLVVRVPRQGAKRPSSSLVSALRQQASLQRIRLQGHNRGHDPTTSQGAGADNASEWNSLLIHARAERGPQWDVATQMFHVDRGSDLYFDSTPLTTGAEPPPSEDPSSDPSSSMPPMGDPFTLSGVHQHSMRTPSRQPQHNPYQFMTPPNTQQFHPGNMNSHHLQHHPHHQQPQSTQEMLYRQMAQQQQHQNAGSPYGTSPAQLYGNVRSPVNGMHGMVNGLPPGMINGHVGSPTGSLHSDGMNMNGRGGYPGMYGP